MRLYSIRLSTTEAYRVYMEGDPESTRSNRSTSSTGGSSRSGEYRSYKEPNTEASAIKNSVHEVQGLEASVQLQMRQELWKQCFPTCSESAWAMFVSFKHPVIILYCTIGLNLIAKGATSVPAFSRELKTMDLCAEDRTVIVGFLAKAFSIV